MFIDSVVLIMPMKGENIYHFADKVEEFAKHLEGRALACFNDVYIKVVPGLTANDFLNKYQKQEGIM